MKRPRLRSFIIFGLAGLAGTLLLHTSQNVQKAEQDLRNLKSAVESERESIRVLKAEWAYLNSPLRLESLTREHLDLVPPPPDHLLREAAALPAPVPVPAETQQNELYQDIGLKTPPAAPVQEEQALNPPPLAPARKPERPEEDFSSMLNRLSREGGG